MSLIVFNRKLYVVEGFDIVGKTSFIEKYMKKYNVYNPTYDLIDKTLERPNVWVMNYSVVDYLKQCKKPEYSIINEGIIGNQVSSRIYNNKFLDSKIIEYFKNDSFYCKEIGHIYLKHKDIDSAKIIYDKVINNKDNENKVPTRFDIFHSFSDYWIYYNNADIMYTEMYKEFNIEPRIFQIDIENNDFEEVFPHSID